MRFLIWVLLIPDEKLKSCEYLSINLPAEDIHKGRIRPTRFCVRDKLINGRQAPKTAETMGLDVPCRSLIVAWQGLGASDMGSDSFR